MQQAKCVNLKLNIGRPTMWRINFFNNRINKGIKKKKNKSRDLKIKIHCTKVSRKKPSKFVLQ